MGSQRDKSGLGYLLEEAERPETVPDVHERPDPIDPVPEAANGARRPVPGPAHGPAPRGDLDEIRDSSRRTLTFEVLLEEGSDYVRTQGYDLSRGGIFVATRHHLPAGEVVSAKLRVAERTIPVIAEVVWERVEDPSGAGLPPGMGLKFLDIEDADADYIDSVISD